jgi:hypothetical protein
MKQAEKRGKDKIGGRSWKNKGKEGRWRKNMVEKRRGEEEEYEKKKVTRRREKEEDKKEKEGFECWKERGAEGERGRWREKEVAVEKRRNGEEGKTG